MIYQIRCYNLLDQKYEMIEAFDELIEYLKNHQEVIKQDEALDCELMMHQNMYHKGRCQEKIKDFR